MRLNYSVIWDKNEKRTNLDKHVFNKTILKLIFIFIVCILAAEYFLPAVWQSNMCCLHAAFELFCIFSVLVIFAVSWSIYEHNTSMEKIIGFGFLTVAIFDLLHTVYFPGLRLYPAGYYDLAAWYWIIGRLTEALTILIAVSKTFEKAISKWKRLFITLAAALLISSAVLYFQGLLPVLLIEGGALTGTKVLLEYIVVSIFIVALFNTRRVPFYRVSCSRAPDSRVPGSREAIINSHLRLALIVAIPAELCFTLSGSFFSFHNILGHMLKAVYYYYLLKGMFISAVIYPYKQLYEANLRVSDTNSHTVDLLNRLPIAIASFNKDYRLKFMNKKAAEITGYTLEEVKGHTVDRIAELLYGTSAANAEEHLATRLDSTSTAELGMIRAFITKQGQIKNTVIDAQMLENGEYIYIFKEAKDEQSLENLRLQSQTILNAIDKAVFVTDAENRIVMCSKVLLDTFELSEDEVLGMNKNEFDRQQQLTICGAMSGNSEHDAENSAYKVSVITRSGKKKELLSNIYDIYNIEGKRIGKVGIASDITDLNKEQTRMQQQEKLALIGQMAAGIVHEIKNPLSAIKGFSQLINVKTKESKTKEYAEAIDSSINGLNKVVSDFLRFARPLPTIMKELQLNEIVRSMELLVSTHAYTKGVTCAFSYSEQELPIVADEGQLKQVILNISENAIDAMSESMNPQLKIHTCFNSGSKEMVLKISDNGKGISKENINKVGTPFFTTKEKGTGLGMSISYQIVSEHNGMIEIESEQGAGTTFIVTLPCYCG